MPIRFKSGGRLKHSIELPKDSVALEETEIESPLFDLVIGAGWRPRVGAAVAVEAETEVEEEEPAEEDAEDGDDGPFARFIAPPFAMPAAAWPHYVKRLRGLSPEGDEGEDDDD